jgi:hypothetical protein
VRALVAILALIVALAVQTTLAALSHDGTAVVDLVLVLSVYIAVTSGAGAGLLTATVAGLLQDSLSSGILGIGALGENHRRVPGGGCQHPVHPQRDRPAVSSRSSWPPLPTRSSSLGCTRCSTCGPSNRRPWGF